MIDKLSLNMPFKKEFIHEHIINDDNSIFYVHKEIIPVSFMAADVQIIRDKESKEKYIVSELKTKFESLPSSYTGIAIKVFDTNRMGLPYVNLKCSPAYLLQGHNLYGHENMEKALLSMLGILATENPALFAMLDIENITLSHIDITYSIFINNQQLRYKTIKYLSNISNGQTKARGQTYDSTVYFGAKNSKVKRLKVYLKHPEMLNQLSKNKYKKNYQETAKIIKEKSETDYAKTAMRFEATIMNEYLRRRNIPTNIFKLLEYIKHNKNFYKDIFNEAWKDIFKTFENDEIKLMDDKRIYDLIHDTNKTITPKGNISVTKVERIYSFYLRLKNDGYYSVRNTMSESSQRRNFERSVKALIDSGISKSFLQNITTDSNVIQFKIPQIINFDFDAQLPDDYVEPESLFPDLKIG